MPGPDVAFVRSRVAHARLRGITVPEQFKDAVITAEDLAGVKPIPSNPPLRGFKLSTEPILASDKVRFVGEIVAMCVAQLARRGRGHRRRVTRRLRRAAGGDRHARRAQEPARRWCTRSGATTSSSTFSENAGGRAIAAQAAAIKVTREIRTARHCMLPMEGRGVLAYRDAAPASSHRGHLHADAAFGADRPRRVPWPRGRRRPRHLPRRRRRLRLQGPAQPRGGRARVAGARSSIIPCAGSRIAASI